MLKKKIQFTEWKLKIFVNVGTKTGLCHLIIITLSSIPAPSLISQYWRVSDPRKQFSKPIFLRSAGGGEGIQIISVREEFSILCDSPTTKTQLSIFSINVFISAQSVPTYIRFLPSTHAQLKSPVKNGGAGERRVYATCMLPNEINYLAIIYDTKIHFLALIWSEEIPLSL